MTTIPTFTADSLRSNLYNSAANSNRNRQLKRNMTSTDTNTAVTGLFLHLLFSFLTVYSLTTPQVFDSVSLYEKTQKLCSFYMLLRFLFL